jgi:hypothetical protein
MPRCRGDVSLKEAKGNIACMRLPGVGRFPSCTISFEFEVVLKGTIVDW